MVIRRSKWALSPMGNGQI